MQNSEAIEKLLEEIRDINRDHLAAYRVAVQLSLELQQRAVQRQEQMGTLYKRAVTITFAVIAGILLIIAYIMTKYNI